MKSRHRRALGLGSLLAAFLTSCGDLDAPLDPITDTAPVIVPTQYLNSPTLDEEWARIAREEVPGFAGYSLDPDGSVVLYLAQGAAPGPAQ